MTLPDARPDHTGDPAAQGAASGAATDSSDLPLVSIVTPSYNQAEFIEETIRSVLEQDYPSIEYLVVDGGSTDGSVDIIRRYADPARDRRISWWVSEQDGGQATALNKGFTRASGSILAWLNSDDTYMPGAISEAVGYLRQHEDVGMVYGNALLVDETGRVLGPFPARQTDLRRIKRGSVHIPQPSAFFRASLLRSVGLLDSSLNFALDYELWLRFARETRLCYHPRRWATYRLHGRGKTLRFDDRFYPEMLRVHRRGGGTWCSLLVLKALVRPVVFAWLPLRVRLLLRRLLT